MIRTLIAESESHSLKRLKMLLRDFPEIQVIGEAGDAETAASIVEGLKPDLLLFDVQLTIANDFAILENISYQPMAILATPYLPFVVRALEDNAIDYLLKPFSRERFARTIRRTLQRKQRVNGRLVEILKAAARKTNSLNRFAVQSEQGLLMIPAEKVYYFKSENGNVSLSTFNREFGYDTSLRQLEEILNPEQFCRIHENYIIALGQIKKLRRGWGRQHRVQLDNKEKTALEIGRNYLQSLGEKLKA